MVVREVAVRAATSREAVTQVGTQPRRIEDGRVGDPAGSGNDQVGCQAAKQADCGHPGSRKQVGRELGDILDGPEAGVQDQVSLVGVEWRSLVAPPTK